MLTSTKNTMIGLGLWTRTLDSVRCARLKTRKKSSKLSSKGMSLLSKKKSSSDPGEFAAVHHAQMSLLIFSDVSGKGDDDPAVKRTVGTLSVAGCDAPALKQEKEARIVGGIPSR